MNAKLTKFKVQNFRSIEDSGWIDAENVTCLVGTNESGKTNLLLALCLLYLGLPFRFYSRCLLKMRLLPSLYP